MHAYSEYLLGKYRRVPTAGLAGHFGIHASAGGYISPSVVLIQQHACGWPSRSAVIQCDADRSMGQPWAPPSSPRRPWRALGPMPAAPMHDLQRCMADISSAWWLFPWRLTLVGNTGHSRQLLVALLRREANQNKQPCPGVRGVLPTKKKSAEPAFNAPSTF
jgi:hypothetical protein